MHPLRPWLLLVIHAGFTFSQAVAANYTAQVSALDRQIQELQGEKQQALAQLRSGLYCSKCKLTAVEIERGGKSFSQHLKEVQGRAIPADQATINQKSREYDAKVAQLQQQRDRLVRSEWEDGQREQQHRQQQVLVDRQAAEQRNQTVRQERTQQVQNFTNGVMNALDQQRENARRAEDRRYQREREDFERAHESTLDTQKVAVRLPQADLEAADAAVRRAEVERNRVVYLAKIERQAEQDKLATARQSFSGLLDEYRETHLLDNARGNFGAAHDNTSAAVEAFSGFVREVSQKTAGTLFDEMVGQVKGGVQPNLKEAAKSGGMTVVQDTARDIFNGIVDQLPDRDRFNLRAIDIPLSWTSMDPQTIWQNGYEPIMKEIRSDMDKIEGKTK